MGNEEFEALALQLVRHHYDSVHHIHIRRHEAYITWMAKVLGNNKAFISTTEMDGRYFEVTYNGETGETCLYEYLLESTKVYDLSDNGYEMVE